MKQCPECKRAYEDANSFCVFDGQRLVMVEPDDPCIGMMIDGKYRIERKIARGGTGMVYQATHIQLSTPVAIKIIHPSLANDPRSVERFRREALITMKVRHTNAIAIMDFGMTTIKLPESTTNKLGPMGLNITETNSVYVVMELLKGNTLEHKMTEIGRFSPSDANNVLQQLCAALAIAHDHHIVHRDLKPDNIFFHKDEDREVVKLVDFGIARYKGNVEDEEEAMRLTQAGFVVGTPFYMSPEQCAGLEVDARSDIYSLGIILYRMLTGKLPFAGNKASLVVMKHLSEKPKPIYEVCPDLPAVLNGVIMHALSKKPEDRPQNILELAHEFESAVKAITEHDLQKVFLDATESDLEAALLLTSNPGTNLDMLTDSVSRFSGRLDASFLKNLAMDEDITPEERLQASHLIGEMWQISKSLSENLEVLNTDMSKNIFPTSTNVTDVKNLIDQMRGLVFGLQTNYYK